MAGGTFIAQNKVRPGAYINFKAVSAPAISVGARGVAAMPLATGWGANYIELYSTELQNGKSIAKVGCSFVDEEALLYRLILANTYKLLIARTDVEGGRKAEATIGGLKAEARYVGTVGNRLSIIVARVGETAFYDVTTALDGIGKDTQRVDAISKLVSNDWVVFSDVAEEPPGSFTVSAGMPLTNGANGTETSASIGEAIALLATKQFNVLGCMSEEEAVKSLVVSTIKQLRENEGRKCKAVLLNSAGLSGSDYEGIISCNQGYKTQDGEITAAQFIAQLTGLCAGAELGKSLTHATIPDAIEVVGAPTSHDDIVSALKAGWIVLSQLNDGTVIIEQDINTLCNDLTNKDDSFKKNLIINTLDEIGNTIQLTWDKTYCGKVHNNATQRTNYKAALVQYFRQLESLELIQDFDKDSDIIIEQGENLDSVVVNWWVKPVDVMEKLYMTTYVNR